ncbi:uncharacterized protein ARMOST_07576 [Armillaria ostoyae]|uniref:Retrotransposon gag domain-containing protein n=1 Tax=Armillaria ostoyae TaxID=47428 RepID=A0A284R680_ARMOS|nr:uncharacterized protein ARMOST_07576 [Armillaria ostoyae]
MGQPLQETPTRLQQRSPFPANSSDKFPQRTAPPQHNATPGPSGTRHTPTPPPKTPSPEVDNRDLQSRYDSFLPPTYDPNDLPPPEWALVPIRPCPIMGFPTAPAQRIFIRAPIPFPDDNSSEDDAPWNRHAPHASQLPPPDQFITIKSSDEDDLDHLTPPHSEPDVPKSVSRSEESRTPSPTPRPLAFTYQNATDPLNLDGPNFEWNELTQIDREILGPHRSTAWELRRRDVEAQFNLRAEDRTPMGWYLAVARGDPLPMFRRNDAIPRDVYYQYQGSDEPIENRSSWSSRYSTWSPANEQPTMSSTNNRFDSFEYDDEEVGELDEVAPWLPRVDDYVPYPYFSTALVPLPDSPNWEYHTHQRRRQGYHAPQYGIYPITRGGDEKPGGSNNPDDKPEPIPTSAECLQEAWDIAERKAKRIEELKEEVAEAERAHDSHVQYWNLPIQDKGKGPDRGRPPAPGPTQPHERQDRYSPNPISFYADDAPHLHIKPMMLAPPKDFKGDHDDIDRYIGDCLTYFEVFGSYFQLHSQMVVFAASHLDGIAKDWWVHLRQGYWVVTDPTVPPWFRYLTWERFVQLLQAML